MMLIYINKHRKSVCARVDVQRIENSALSLRFSQQLARGSANRREYKQSVRTQTLLRVSFLQFVTLYEEG